MDRTDSQLIDRIYAAVQEPGLLLDAYHAVARRGGGFAAHYLRMDTRRRIVVETQVSDAGLREAEQDYAAYYVGVDCRIPWYTSGHQGQWRADQHHFDESYLRRAEIYTDFLKPWGAKRMAVCQLSRDGAATQEVLSIARAHDAGDFSAAELRRLALLSRHLVRAATLRTQLDALQMRSQAAERAIAPLPYHALWLDGRGRVVWASPSAHGMLAAADGLQALGNILRCPDPQLDSRLQAAILRASAGDAREGDCFAIPRRNGAAPWLLSLIPGRLPADLGQQESPHVLALIQDGAGPRLPHPRQLQQLYGFTPAETRLALGLLRHDTPGSYAADNRLSLATVKTHLRSLFAKTGTHRQAELLRLLSRPLPHPPPVG